MAGEAPDARLLDMDRFSTPRHRGTETRREAARLSDAIASGLGVGVRTGRKRLRLTQSELADRVGVHQTWISRIELGHGQAVPISLWIRTGLVLGQPLAVLFPRVPRHPPPPRRCRPPTDPGVTAPACARDRSDRDLR